MVEPIKITKEMREMRDNRQARLDEVITKVNLYIEGAVKEGRTKAWFPNTCNEFFSEVKEIFENAGYTVTPVGVEGGVMQDGCNLICW